MSYHVQPRVRRTTGTGHGSQISSQSRCGGFDGATASRTCLGLRGGLTVLTVHSRAPPRREPSTDAVSAALGMAPSRPCTSTRRSLSYGKVLATRRATPRTACAKWRSTVAVTKCPAKHRRRIRSYCPSLDRLFASHKSTSLPSDPSRPPRPPSRQATSRYVSCRNMVHI